VLHPSRYYPHRDAERDLHFNRGDESDCLAHRIADEDTNSHSNLDQHTATKPDTNTDGITHSDACRDAQLYLDGNAAGHAELLADPYDDLHCDGAPYGNRDVIVNTDAHLHCNQHLDTNADNNQLSDSGSNSHYCTNSYCHSDGDRDTESNEDRYWH
jgi:hypothetical protein